MRALLILFAATGAGLAGCGSSGVLPVDADTYTVSKRGPIPGLGPSVDVRSDVQREAISFCGVRGLGVETIELQVTEGSVALPPNAVLRFRCGVGR